VNEACDLFQNAYLTRGWGSSLFTLDDFDSTPPFGRRQYLTIELLVGLNRSGRLPEMTKKIA